MERRNSQRYFAKALTHLPGGVSSPARSFKSLGLAPLIAKRGERGYLVDLDEHRFLDLCMGWGALILGHAHPKVIEAVEEQIRKGVLWGTCCPGEEELASLIIDSVPSVEQVRFVCSGTEATMTALRMARGITRRSRLVKFSGCYHGHSDPFLARAGSSAAHLKEGISSGLSPASQREVTTLPFNDQETLERFFIDTQTDEIAAFIVEPIAGNQGVIPADPSFLHLLREKSREVGALLIFDEVITGFRVARGGAQAFYGIEADLTCFGKVVGGGFPLSAVGGKREWMEHLSPRGNIFHAGTFAGHPVAIAAGIATLKELFQEGIYEELERKGALLDSLQHTLSEGIKGSFTRIGSMASFQGSQEMFQRLFCFLFEEGIFLPPGAGEAWFISTAHTDEDLERVLRRIDSFFLAERDKTHLEV